ncbi:MAG: hypothetical protein WAK55_17180 [Xanthobacteraceae bacterium]
MITNDASTTAKHFKTLEVIICSPHIAVSPHLRSLIKALRFLHRMPTRNLGFDFSSISGLRTGLYSGIALESD